MAKSLNTAQHHHGSLRSTLSRTVGRLWQHLKKYLRMVVLPATVTSDAFRVLAWHITDLFQRKVLGKSRKRMGPCWTPSVPAMKVGEFLCPICPFSVMYRIPLIVRALCANSQLLRDERGRKFCVCVKDQFSPHLWRWLIGLVVLLCIWAGIVYAGGWLLYQGIIRFASARVERAQYLPVVANVKVSDITDSERKRAQESVRSARTYLGDKRYSAARIEYRSAIQRDPTLVEAYTGLAECCLQLALFGEAREALGKVITLDPASPAAYRKLTELAGRQRDFKQAFVHARKLCDLQPNDKESRLLLSSCYISVGDLTNAAHEVALAVNLAPGDPEPLLAAAYIETLRQNADGAEKRYKDAIAVCATNVPARIGLARICRDRGKIDEATDFLRSILRTEPQCADAIIEMGLLKGSQGKWQETVELYRRSARLYPKLYTVREELVRILMNLGRVNEGYDAAVQLIAADPENTTANLILSETFLERGFVSLAEDYDRKVLRMNPNLVAAHRLMARILMKKGDVDRSLDYFKRIALALPDDIESQLRLAFCIELKGDRSKAEALLLQTAERFQESPLAFVHLGEFYLRGKKPEMALPHFRNATARKPENPMAMNNLASILLDQPNGDQRSLDEALQLAGRAWELAPDSAAVADTLGWANYLKGDHDAAMALLFFAEKKAPSNPEVRYHLGCLYYSKGKLDKARAQFEAALGMSSDFPGVERARSLLAESKRKNGG